ncbi:MAG: ADP-ribosylglycohydrolase family protein [Oscillospiraceae bacterium]|jgi:ADP-ribosylglycohydrolase|nr:ADP-ribosylglycohydrolase family protein [Oscillospiraceae bacterium]
MYKIKSEYINKIYAGWLAKVIGVRLGAAIEGWTYEKIKEVYGVLDYYPVDYKDFAADDDTNGPMFFIRALEDSKNGFDITAQDVGDALLNYASFEKSFFWWGGYGISTEHTAYQNLRSGIKAPHSGSVLLNGSTVAEQIGGQIFIDSWGLVTPGNPDLAAKYASLAASVTHGGNGVYGGIFIATCISYAFEETDIQKIIEKGLSYIPSDSEYTRVTRAVMNYHKEHPDNWRDCYKYVFENFGYDKYPGACHIIPNSALIILALLYGNGDFADTINICNMCGWDTDCNVGNIATIMGVRGGTESINYEKWRKPINDFLACSSVIGSLNIMDIPYGASYFTKLAWAIAGEELPATWKEIISKRIDSCHFEFPGSTHAIRTRVEKADSNGEIDCNRAIELINTDEASRSGSRSLKVVVMHKPSVTALDKIYVHKKTYYTKDDFHDARYHPSFSPLLYPGQTVHGSVYLPDYGIDCTVSLYARNAATGEDVQGESIPMKRGEWLDLSMKIPGIEGGLIDEAGFVVEPCDIYSTRSYPIICLIDDLYFDGKPDYSIDFDKCETEIWEQWPRHFTISQLTILKGLVYLEDKKLHISCSDYAEVYTGRHDWEDYTASYFITPLAGNDHAVNFRVQGALRSYSAGFEATNSGEPGKLYLSKNENGYRKLAEVDFHRKLGQEYKITVTAKENNFTVSVDDTEYINYKDTKDPYLKGSIGISTRNGSHSSISKVVIN